MNIIESITARQLKNDIPEFRVGNTVKVGYKVTEGKVARTQYFEGIVIARKGTGIAETFTVRKVSSGVGVERIFPVNAPTIDKIVVIKKGKVRRAKLNFIKGMRKEYKVKERS